VVNINKAGLLAKAGDHDEVDVYAALQHGDNQHFFEQPELRENALVRFRVVGGIPLFA
jgi:hypothetical protein